MGLISDIKHAIPFKKYKILMNLSFQLKMTEYRLAITLATHLKATISANIKYFLDKDNKRNTNPPINNQEGKSAAIQLQKKCILFNFITGS